MRIAQIAPIIESVPPKGYGGTERVISALTEELVKRGHEVTLFASGDSETKAELFSVFHTSLRKAHMEDMYGPNIWSLLNVGIAYQMQDQFDIIHDHNSQNNPVSLPLANLSRTPVIMTLHGPLTNGYNKAFDFYKKPYLVTISKKQAEPSPDLNYIGNVYHGLPMSYYPYSSQHDGYLLFVGRVHFRHGVEEKGLHHAIDIAERLDLPLMIAARLEPDFPDDVAYFNEKIKPRLKGKIRWIGEVDEAKRNKLMSRAMCLIHSINFPEPFGLTLIEAMATGCPVVAFNKGSIPEIIKDGKTGFVVENSEQAIEAIKKIGTIDKRYCRDYALTNFSAERMAEDYERIYMKATELKAFGPVIKRFDSSLVTQQVNSLRKPMRKSSLPQ